MSFVIIQRIRRNNAKFNMGINESNKKEVKTVIGLSEQMFIEDKEIKEEDITDCIWEALKKAESEGSIIDSCPAV